MMTHPSTKLPGVSNFAVINPSVKQPNQTESEKQET